MIKTEQVLERLKIMANEDYEFAIDLKRLEWNDNLDQDIVLIITQLSTLSLERSKALMELNRIVEKGGSDVGILMTTKRAVLFGKSKIVDLFEPRRNTSSSEDKIEDLLGSRQDIPSCQHEFENSFCKAIRKFFTGKPTCETTIKVLCGIQERQDCILKRIIRISVSISELISLINNIL